MQKIIDISWPLTPDITEYKDRASIVFETHEQDRGFEVIRESIIRMHTHTGTHVDAPRHFLPDGVGIDQIALESLIGACVVLDCTSVQDCIDEQFLSACISQNTINAGDIVVLKTRNSARDPQAPFDPHFVYLHESGARFLVERNVKAVGIDYLGIERAQPRHETHHILLGACMPIIEGLQLMHVLPGRYTLVCLPIALRGLDAAPARAVLLPASN